eukprot:GHUV01019493.1.p1 GENE.GHUV01019493.1~~GHUV01019493.1.p1  ORF type:complete len:602 (+),score=224.84 GHUV01019493.1:1356-3161(+)
MGDVYIKRRSGQGIAVYEARCADLGIIPVNQVIQQLDRPQANMAHCKLGSEGAKALGAALAAASNIAALDLRDNGLDGKAISHILAGITTATASALTDRARQHNIQMANQSMGTIASNMASASVTQPPYQFTPDFVEPAEQYTAVSSPKRRAAGSTAAVTWEAQQPGAAGSFSSNARSSMAPALDDTANPKASWAGNSSSGHEPDAPEASLSGGKAGPAAVAEALNHVDPELLVESLTGQMSRTNIDDGSDTADPDDFAAAVQGPGAEAQLALQHVTPGQLSRDSLAKIGQHAAGGQLFVAPRTSTDEGLESTLASPSRLGADAGDLELDMNEEDLQQFTSVPATPAVHHDAAGATGGATSGYHIRKPSVALPNSSTGSQQGPASPFERGNRSLVEFRSNSSMVAGRAGGEQGHVYSVMSELDLSQNPIGIAGAKAVAELLNPEKNPGQFLISLNLSKCNIPEAGGLQLVAALQAGNLKLRRLGMSNNALGNKTAAGFGDLLESNHTLRELDLGWNQIKADGAKALARGLAANATLSELVLCWNGIEAAGGAALGEMLALNMGLKVLDLSHCRLGPEACLLLGEGLKVGCMCLAAADDRCG